MTCLKELCDDSIFSAQGLRTAMRLFVSVFIMVTLCWVEPLEANEWNGWLDQVRKLDQLDQKAIILTVRGYTRLMVRRHITEKEKTSDRKTFVQAVRMHAIVNAGLYSLTSVANWPRMREYFRRETNNAVEAGSKEISFDRYLTVSKFNSKIYGELIKPHDNSNKFNSIMKRHEKLSNRIGQYIFERSLIESLPKKISEIKNSCLSELTKFDVCEYARKIQNELASQLPMKFSKNVMLDGAVSIKNRLVLKGIWNFSDQEIDQMLTAGRMTREAFQQKMDISTRNYVCSNKLLTAFVNLGGQVQYVYASSEGTIVHSPMITDCK